MTQALEDYLEAIYLLIRNTGRARVRDIAETLNVKMPSVVNAVSELKKVALVTQEPYGDIQLTEQGKQTAILIANRHTTLKNFLISIGVSLATAEIDACKMEHILSAETMEKISQYSAKN